MNLREAEHRIFGEALETLGKQTQGIVKLLRKQRGPFDPRFDAQVQLELHGQTILLVAEIRNVDRRLALVQIKNQLEAAIADHLPGYIPLLVIPYMTEAMAEECRRINLPFVDTAGNLFVQTRTILLYIVGRPRPDQIGR